MNNLTNNLTNLNIVLHRQNWKQSIEHVAEDYVYPCAVTALLHYSNKHQQPFEIQYVITSIAESIFSRGGRKGIFATVLPLYIGNMYVNTFHNDMQMQRVRMWLEQGTTGLRFLHCMDLAGKLYLAAVWIYYFVTIVYPRSILYRKRVNMSFSSGWLLVSLMLYKHFRARRGSLIGYMPFNGNMTSVLA